MNTSRYFRAHGAYMAGRYYGRSKKFSFYLAVRYFVTGSAGRYRAFGP